jgi:hypothetical protein
MNKHLMRAILFCSAALLIVLGIAWLSPARAEAALGNTGVPARCYNIGWNGSGFYLTCTTPPGSGVSFVGSQRVPAGYYFMITDLWATPASGTTTDGVTDFYLQDCYSEASIQSVNHFRNLEGATYGQHFNAPMWVLLADHRLQVVPQAANQQNFEIRVNGFLVTNLNYIPLASAP